MGILTRGGRAAPQCVVHALIGYISAKGPYPDWETYWKSEDTKMVHFIGKDNIVFHCIVFPSMLKAHGGYILP